MGKTRIKTEIRTEGLGSVTWRYCWLCLTEGDKTMGKNCEKNLGLVNCIGIDEAGVRGIRLKKWGGRGEGLDWCMAKAGVRYTRIPDPAHVLSARGWARGKERKTNNHRIRGPIKNV